MTDAARARRVLVVDDEQDVRDLLTCMLSSEGYEVTTAADGVQALAAATAGGFDVTTVDLRMPGLGGRETLVALRRLAPSMPVIVVSGYVTAAEAHALRALGAFAVLPKPFNVHSLLQAVTQACGQEENTLPGS